MSDARRHKHLVFLPAAGVVSAFLTMCIENQLTPHLQMFVGAFFGLALAGYFALTDATSSLWVLGRFVAVTAIAYLAASFVAFAVQTYLPWQESVVHQTTVESPSPLALFAGGMVGAFLVLGEALYLFGPKATIRSLAVRALSWSALGGILGVIGWKLGSTVGVALWSFVHALHLTAPTEGPRNALSNTAPAFSLLLVWQTGMAFVLGVMMRRYSVKPRAKETEPS